MTDPRIDILAAAMPDIMDAETCEYVMGPGVDRLDCPEEWFLSPREMAAAILAALPPDWCGHKAELDDAWLTMDNQQAEIARLRRIEEAARYVDQLAHQQGYDDAEWEQALAALRAALRRTDDL